jgi:hypothetical protein
MLLIQQPIEELRIPPEVTIGTRKRYSTATAVAWINDKKLVSAAFNSRKVYLIELTEDGGSRILDVVKAPYNPDLMDYKDGVIVTSDYPFSDPHGHSSVFDLIDDKLVYRKSVTFPSTKSHGCEIVDDNTVIITSNSDFNKGCLFVDINKGVVKHNLTNMDHYPKDAYIKDDRLLVVCAKSLPQIGQTTVIGESVLYLFDVATLTRLDEIRFHGQTDSLTMDGEHVFVTIQGDDTVAGFTLIDDKLSYIGRAGGFNFPHGIDALNGRIAITNYGDNTIRIFTKDELLQNLQAS